MEKPKIQTPQAFYNIYSVGRKMGIPKSTIAQTSGDGRAIQTIPELEPIAHLFVCFEDDNVKSYAIRKRYFDKWRSTGIVPKKSPGRPKKYDDGVKNTKHINIPAPDFYDIFVAGIRRCNKNSIQQITVQSFIHIAIKEAMDRRIDIFYPELKEGINDK